MIIGGSTRVFLEVVAATLLGFGVLSVLGAWRLSQGPVPLTFLTPAIEEALSKQSPGLTVTIGDTILTWAGRARNLDILAVGVKVRASDGRVVASVPEVSINFSARALLRGIIAPTRLELIGPRLLLVRTRSRGFELAFADSGTMSEEQARRFVRGLLPAVAKTSALSYLKRISLIGAKLTVDDRVTGTIWGSPRTDAVISRDGRNLRADFEMDVDMGGDTLSRLYGNVSYRPDEKRIHADVQFADLRLDLVAKKLPGLQQLDMVRLAIDGRAVVELDDGGRVLAADFDITGKDGNLAPSAAWPEGLAIKSLKLRGRLQQNPDFVVFDEVRLDTGGPTIAGNGVITRIGENAAINAHLVMRGMPASAFGRYWPRNLALNPRQWVTGNITDGMVSELRVEISAHTEIDGKGGAQLDSLTGTLQFDGATVQYLKPLPPARNVTGAAVFNRERIVFTIRKAEVEGLRAQSGSIKLTRLDTDNEHAQIELVIHGPLQNALRLIDHPALKLADRVGIDADATTGEMATRLVLDFPLTLGIGLDQINIGAAANLRGVTFPAFIRGQGISNGDLTLRLDRTGLDVKGTAQLGPTKVTLEWYEDFADDAKIRRRYRFQGVLGEAERSALGIQLAPYLRGSVNVDLALLQNAEGKAEVAVKLDLKPAGLDLPLLGWSKPPGIEGIAWLTLRLADEGTVDGIDFDVRSSGLRSRGTVALADGDRPMRVTLQKFTAGATDVSGTISGRADGGFDVRLTGAGFDAAPLLRRDDESTTADDLPPIRISAELGSLWFGTGPPISAFAGTFVYDGDSWTDIDAEGTLGKDHRIGLSVRKDGAVRKMSLRSTNAGVGLRTLGLFDTMQEGEMILSGVSDRSETGAPWRGRLLITDFRIVDVPLLTRILSLGSLTGIADAMTGKGITFARLEVPYIFKDKVLSLNKARAVGAALGLTANGEIDFARERLKLVGTLVPANTINSILGNIPLLGRILTGLEGEGVFAMTYGIEGPLSKPTVTVNPLTALAPGFLRDLIGAITGSSAKLPPAKSPDAAPPSQ